MAARHVRNEECGGEMALCFGISFRLCFWVLARPCAGCIFRAANRMHSSRSTKPVHERMRLAGPTHLSPWYWTPDLHRPLCPSIYSAGFWGQARGLGMSTGRAWIVPRFKKALGWGEPSGVSAATNNRDKDTINLEKQPWTPSRPGLRYRPSSPTGSVRPSTNGSPRTPPPPLHPLLLVMPRTSIVLPQHTTRRIMCTLSLRL